MCGGYLRKLSPMAFRHTFGFDPPPGLMRNREASWVARPTDPEMILRGSSHGGLEAVLARWWLVPRAMRGAEDARRFPMFNARAETVRQKPAFAEAFRERRCLVPMRALLEWRAQDGVKRPHLIGLDDLQPFACAGVWEGWEGDGLGFESFAIITCPANELVAGVHDRMPVILPRPAWETWLSPASSGTELEALLRPLPARGMELHPVPREVVGSGQRWPEYLAFLGLPRD